MTPEGKVLEQVILEYKKHDLLYERRQAVGGAYRVGSADTWCVINGVHYEVELKASNGQKRNMQLKWEARCKARGVKYYCFNSIDDFRQWLNEKIGPTEK